MPLNLSYWEVIYNKHVFAKYKLAPPTTWAQFQAINKTLRTHGVTPLAATIAGRWPSFIYFEEYLVRSHPKAYLNLMAGKIKYTDPAVVNAMNMWGAMIKEGDFTDPGAVQFGTSGNNDLINLLPPREGWLWSRWAAGTSPRSPVPASSPAWTTARSSCRTSIPPCPKNVIFETGPLVVSARGQNREHGPQGCRLFHVESRPAGMGQCHRLHPGP